MCGGCGYYNTEVKTHMAPVQATVTARGCDDVMISQL